MRATGGQKLTPVVGLGVIALMELLDGGADGGGAAKEDVADGFGWGGWRVGSGKCGRESDLSQGDSGHESGFRE